MSIENFELAPGITSKWVWDSSVLDDQFWTRWDALVASSGEPSAFLDSRMMKSLLEAKDRQVAAISWYKGSSLVGLACVEDTLAQSLNLDKHIESERFWFSAISKLIHGKSGRFSFQVRVLGTSLGSGDHGYRWALDIPESKQIEWMTKSLFKASGPNGNRPPKVSMIKDAPIYHSGQRQSRYRGWIPLEFDPEMIVHINPMWKSLEDYQAEMSTKFRTKVNRILKLSEAFEIREFSEKELEAQAPILIELYQEVFDRSGFRLGSLDADTLVQSKKNWGNQFIVKGYFIEGTLKGFQCAYLDRRDVEAFFVGFRPELLKSHAIYQRMLIEFIGMAIQSNRKRVNMGRTALEIKSTVGALPRRLQCEVRFRSKWLHAAVSWYTKGYNPAHAEIRRPWKENAFPVRRHSELHVPTSIEIPIVSTSV